jgi:hypothetical protein
MLTRKNCYKENLFLISEYYKFEIKYTHRTGIARSTGAARPLEKSGGFAL